MYFYFLMSFYSVNSNDYQTPIFLNLNPELPSITPLIIMNINTPFTFESEL